MSKVYTKLQFEVTYVGDVERTRASFEKLGKGGRFLFNMEEDAVNAAYSFPYRYQWLNIWSGDIEVRKVLVSYQKRTSFWGRYLPALKSQFKTNDVAGVLSILGIIFLVVGVVGNAISAIFGGGMPWTYVFAVTPFFGAAVFGWFGGALLDMDTKQKDKVLMVTETGSKVSLDAL